MSSASQSKVGDILSGMYFKICCTSSDFENDFDGGDSHHEVGNTESRVYQAFGKHLRCGSHVGHLRAVALTIRHFLSTMKLTTVSSFLVKVKALSDFDSHDHNRIKSADEEKNKLCKSGGDMEVLLHSIPFTVLLKRCRDEKASYDLESLPISGHEGRHQGTLLDLLSGLLVSSISPMRVIEYDTANTRLKESCPLSHGAALGVTVLSNLYSNRDENILTSHDSKDIKFVMQAAINHSSPKESLTALKRLLLKSIAAISKYFEAISANSKNGFSIRKVAQYEKLISCFNALLRLTRALGAILEMAPGQSKDETPTQQLAASGGQRGRLDNPADITESDINILTTCASATLSVSNIMTISWTSSEDALCISSICKSVRSVCKIILVSVNFFPKEIFESSRSLFPVMISTALALSKDYQMAIDRAQEQHRILVMHLNTGMRIAGMWSVILSCLVTYAKKLPTSLQSSVPSLVPQKVILHFFPILIVLAFTIFCCQH